MGASGRGHHGVFGLPSGAVADAAAAYAGLWRGLLKWRSRCRAARLAFGSFGGLGRSLGRSLRASVRASVVLVVVLGDTPHRGVLDVAPHGQSPGHDDRDDEGQCENPYA